MRHVRVLGMAYAHIPHCERQKRQGNISLVRSRDVIFNETNFYLKLIRKKMKQLT